MTDVAAPETTNSWSLKARQIAAIDTSGWGVGFRFLQPHNLAFWVYVVGVGGGLLAMAKLFGPTAGFYAPALSAGVLMFGLYLVPWLLLLRHHNRFTSQPAGLLATGVVWGGFAATMWIALPANGALLEIWTKIGGTHFAQNWAAGLTAPINEEFAKALGLVLLIGLAPRLVRSAYDGFIIGAFIGLGFEVVEDVLYVFNGASSAFGVNQFGAAFKIFVVRGASGIVSHALFSAIFCAGLMWVLGRAGDRRVVRGLLVMLMAMVFHFAWDDMAGLSNGSLLLVLALPYLIAVIELVGLFAVLRAAPGQERLWMRELLAPEVEAGTIDTNLVNAVSGLRKDRKAYRRSVGHRRAAQHQEAAAQDLAREIAAAHGNETERVTHARAELVRVLGSG